MFDLCLYVFFFCNCSIEDILADSDSDFDDKDDEKGAPPAKKSKRPASFIQEDPESIVDLADVNAIGRITSNIHNSNSRMFNRVNFLL